MPPLDGAPRFSSLPGLFGHGGDSGWADGDGFGQGQSNCSACIEGIYCPLGTTKEPCYPGEYRDLFSGKCLDAPLGHQASLGATFPTLCPAGTHADVEGLQECKQCPAGTYEPGRGAVYCRPCDIGKFCLEGATGGIACETGTVRNVVGARFQADCELAPLGYFGMNGRPIPCPKGYFQNKNGTGSENDCIKCPEYSTTFLDARTKIEDCECQLGFVEDTSTGVRLCLCEVGEGMLSSGGTDVCEPCQLGKWKDQRGNYKCQECKDETVSHARQIANAFSGPCSTHTSASKHTAPTL